MQPEQSGERPKIIVTRDGDVHLLECSTTPEGRDTAYFHGGLSHVMIEP
ncbi:hypothetical protein FHU39_004437 [Flexivirga oryzae]|uniref:Uncharacterized protein n=1 Tax=Flexivirga oryzae TaxID=1794944 RepID=A0A839NGY9_9MICO|nr:hypothetical protein [Flexivirga oryzae]